MMHARSVSRYVLAIVLSALGTAAAHPLGNFTINHFVRLQVGAERIGVHYVVDMAEIPAFQELQAMGARSDDPPSAARLDAYATTTDARYADGSVLTVDGTRLPLHPSAAHAAIVPGSGGLPTLRLESDLAGPIAVGAGAAHRLRLDDGNHRERIGWHEFVVVPGPGMSVFDSSAFGSAVTDELRAYPQDLLTAPLDERGAELSFARGATPSNAVALRTRDGRPAVPSRDRFVELITVPDLTPGTALLALLVAALLGGLHALSPGHGKTVVGAYLVGSRGTARHAAFLGLTVTITHTLGVFALGLVTLFASRYVVPERVFRILSFVSGAIVLLMGFGLFLSRLRQAIAGHPANHSHHHAHPHSHDATHGHGHTHVPPAEDGAAISWRSLLALGVSGGILPCPSALVVLLSAIALHRVGFGLLLIVAFSIGLASVLTGVGLAFVYAGRWVKPPTGSRRLVHVLPVLSALIITGAGAAICYEALAQAGVRVLIGTSSRPKHLFSVASVLGVGLVFGLKHALDADHVAAVSTIVSERKSVLSSALVGAVWGVGHTLSLLVAGVAVIALHVQIGERMASALEFGVAIMLIVLGANALRRLIRGGRMHVHVHRHGDRAHVHPHAHERILEAAPHTHHAVRFGTRPFIVGMVHGLAGSATLMLLVLSTIPSAALAFAYIAVFGLGSIGGMCLMSALVSLPAQLTTERFAGANLAVRTLAGVFSVGLGMLMAYQIGIVDRLFL